MAIRKFITSVATVDAYDASDNLLFSSRTLLDSNIEVKTGSTEIRGGLGSQLLYVYYHTGAMNISLTDTQWNLSMVSKTLGADITTGNNIYTSETVTLDSGKSATVSKTPLALPNSGVIYGWVELPNNKGTEKVTFTGSSFTSTNGASGDVCCVTYYAADAASRSITIPANILPSSVRLVMNASLNSGDQAGANRIGTLQVIVPKAQLSGSFTLSLKSDGVSNTPLSCMALADTDLTSAACSNTPIYAKLIEIIDNTNWYDNVVGLSIENGNQSLDTTTGTKQLKVWAVKDNGDAPFPAPLADLTFSSASTSVATVSIHGGLVTGLTAGTSLISVYITSKSSIDTQNTITVPA